MNEYIMLLLKYKIRVQLSLQQRCLPSYIWWSSFYSQEPVPSQESVQSCICVSGIKFAFSSTIFHLDFETVWTVWYFTPKCLYQARRVCSNVYVCYD